MVNMQRQKLENISRVYSKTKTYVEVHIKSTGVH